MTHYSVDRGMATVLHVVSSPEHIRCGKSKGRAVSSVSDAQSEPKEVPTIALVMNGMDFEENGMWVFHCTQGCPLKLSDYLPQVFAKF
jgi:hypothetical protein